MGKIDIRVKFSIDDKQRAINCYEFFKGHFFRCKNQEETFLPNENISIYFELDQEEKRGMYAIKFRNQ